jgi:hypothetical protein
MTGATDPQAFAVRARALSSPDAEMTVQRHAMCKRASETEVRIASEAVALRGRCLRIEQSDCYRASIITT